MDYTPEEKPYEPRGGGIIIIGLSKVLCWLPKLEKRDCKIKLWEGFVINISVILTTKPRWRRLSESKPDSGWIGIDFACLMLGLKVDW